MTEKKLTRNAAECVSCGRVLESKHRHDYRTHECKHAPGVWFMVDGGLDYVRRGWGGEGKSKHPQDHYIERSEYAE